jgi:hypothetical protein
VAFDFAAAMGGAVGDAREFVGEVADQGAVKRELVEEEFGGGTGIVGGEDERGESRAGGGRPGGCAALVDTVFGEAGAAEGVADAVDVAAEGIGVCVKDHAEGRVGA